MTSGKAAKRRRAAQPARGAGKRARGKASPKVLLAGAAVLILTVAAVVLGVGLTRGDGESASGPPGATLPEAARVAALLRGIPQSGNVLGSPSAAVTMVEYVDLQCPYCREFVSEVFPTLVDKYVRPGKLRVELRGLYFLGPDSERGMRAAQAAALQDRMFNVVELLYSSQGGENSGWLSDGMVEAAARSVPGLDVGKLLADADSGAVADTLAADSARAEQDGVRGTPTIFVGPTGGTLSQVQLASATDLAAIEQAIAAAGA